MYKKFSAKTRLEAQGRSRDFYSSQAPDAPTASPRYKSAENKSAGKHVSHLAIRRSPTGGLSAAQNLSDFLYMTGLNMAGLARNFMVFCMAFLLVACDSNGYIQSPDQAEVEAAPASNSPAPPTALVVVNQPQSQTLTEGQPLSLSVSVDGSGPFDYQWRKDGLTIPGADQPSYNISSASPDDAGRYVVQVSNNAEIKISDEALVTVSSNNSQTPPPTTPEPIAKVVIVQQPVSISVTEGQPAQLSVTATGGGKLTFQWLKNGAIIAGADQSHYSISSSSLGNQGNYSVVVSNSVSSQTSLNALLSVTPKVEAVSITQSPVSISADKGTNVSFSVAASGGGQLQYQWLKNGQAMAGQNSSILNLTNVSAIDAGNYSVRVSNSTSSVTSQNAALSINTTFSVSLNWSIPTQKQDGSALALYEIGGYTIQYGTAAGNLSNTLNISSASTTSATLNSLAAGTYYLRIATLDSSLIPGEYSQVFSFTLM